MTLCQLPVCHCNLLYFWTKVHVNLSVVKPFSSCVRNWIHCWAVDPFYDDFLSAMPLQFMFVIANASSVRFKLLTLMWSETIGLYTRPVWGQKIGLGLGLAGLLLYCETWSCHARHHNDLEGQSNFSSTIYSFSILCLEHNYCGDQQWRSPT